MELDEALHIIIQESMWNYIFTIEFNQRYGNMDLNKLLKDQALYLLPVKILPKESHGEIQMMKTDFSIWKSK